MVTWVTSCNKVCYFVTCFSPNSEVCENPTGGRSWFFTSVGLEVFPRKNLVSIISFAHFSLNFCFWGFQEQPLQTGPKPVLQKTAKILQQNSPPSCVCVLSFLTPSTISRCPTNNKILKVQINHIVFQLHLYDHLVLTLKGQLKLNSLRHYYMLASNYTERRHKFPFKTQCERQTKFVLRL